MLHTVTGIGTNGMASCYEASCEANSETPSFKKSNLPWLPHSATLRDGCPVIVRALGPTNVSSACALLNHAIVVDRAWPFEAPLSEAAFKSYFCSHASFTVTKASNPDVPLGIFYVKPNFPGRCDHVCNGGFVTEESSRRRGVGRLMAECFFRAAKDLEYKAVMFNLVFANNPASVSLWKSVGMTQIGVLPSVARMPLDRRPHSGQGPNSSEEAFEYVDGHVLYRSLS